MIKLKIGGYSKVPKFMHLNLPFYFNPLMPFSNPLVLSLIRPLLLPRHSLLSLSVHVISLLSSSTYMHLTFAPNVINKLFTPIPLLSAYPSPYFASQLFPLLHFANAVVKLLFPSTFFTLCLLTTQIKSLPPSHKL